MQPGWRARRRPYTSLRAASRSPNQRQPKRSLQKSQSKADRHSDRPWPGFQPVPSQSSGPSSPDTKTSPPQDSDAGDIEARREWRPAEKSPTRQLPTPAMRADKDRAPQDEMARSPSRYKGRSSQSRFQTVAEENARH